MASLSDVEKSIVLQLAGLTLDGGPLFAAVSAANGPVSSALLATMMRERMPAAYVVFISEKLAPETDPTELGPRFSVLLADRALRQGTDARSGDPPSHGLYVLVTQSRTALDLYTPGGADYVLTPVAQNALASDVRQGIIQLTYQARPVT